MQATAHFCRYIPGSMEVVYGVIWACVQRGCGYGAQLSYQRVWWFHCEGGEVQEGDGANEKLSTEGSVVRC